MNKLNGRRNCLLFWLLLSILSCKKEDQIKGHLTGSYITDSLLSLSAPVMYTKSTLITDSNFIKSYVSRRSNWYPNPFPCTTCSFPFNSTTELATSKIRIDFSSLAQGTVQFDNYSNVNCFIQVKDNNAIFISKDTIPLGSGDGPCSQLVNKTIVYKAPYDTCRVNSTSSGTSSWCASQPVELVVSLSGDLYLPVVKAFTGKTIIGVGNCFEPAQFLNVFKTDFQNFLAAGDTVVVQQKRWRLKRL